jgi:hypothetical protein
VLHVFDGKLTGKGLRYGDAKRTNDVVNEWPAADGTVEWAVRLAAPARFKVTVNYSTATKDNTGAYTVAAGDRSLAGRVTPTEKPAAFRTDELGELTLPAGEHTVTVRATELAGGSLMRLRQLEFIPLK